MKRSLSRALSLFLVLTLMFSMMGAESNLFGIALSGLEAEENANLDGDNKGGLNIEPLAADATEYTYTVNIKSSTVPTLKNLETDSQLSITFNTSAIGWYKGTFTSDQPKVSCQVYNTDYTASLTCAYQGGGKFAVSVEHPNVYLGVDDWCTGYINADEDGNVTATLLTYDRGGNRPWLYTWGGDNKNISSEFDWGAGYTDDLTDGRYKDIIPTTMTWGAGDNNKAVYVKSLGGFTPGTTYNFTFNEPNNGNDKLSGNTLAMPIDTRPQYTFNIYYYRYANDATAWSVSGWNGAKGSGTFTSTTLGSDTWGKITLTKGGSNTLDFLLVRTASMSGTWDKDGGDRQAKIASGQSGEFYIIQGDNKIYTEQPVMGGVSNSAGAIADTATEVKVTFAVNQLGVDNTTWGIYDGTSKISTGVTGEAGSNSYTFTVPTMSPNKVYTFKDTNIPPVIKEANVIMHGMLNSYKYSGNDLGLTFNSNGTGTFKVWSPTAKLVRLMLYDSLDYNSDYDNKGKVIRANLATGTPVAMTQPTPSNGVWECTTDLTDYEYYMYEVTQADGTIDYAVDPYARSTSANGQVTAILDISKVGSVSPLSDKAPTKNSDVDEILYELHIRDFSIHDSSGVKDEWQGTYMAFTEEGTTYTKGGKTVATGIDHLVELGITTVHLLPTFDYGSTNELATDRLSFDGNNAFNWGYDPLNYNVPEGAYSTDPKDPAKRVAEFKAMVSALHEAGIRVVMDVVYNHTYEVANGPFQRVVPYYYYRLRADGTFADASGCGNETASDNVMMRKYMIDSVLYWQKEYGIDGFRFDLMAIHDTQTMADLTAAVKAVDPKCIVYGEPWMADWATPRVLYDQTTKGTQKDKGFAYFNDDFRGAIKGGGDNGDKAFAQGAGSGIEGKILSGVYGTVNADTNRASESINYVTAHDNLNLWDKMRLSLGHDNSESDPYGDPGNMAYAILSANLSTGIIMTSQGVPFFQAGDEFFRTKQGNHNSYNANDTINAIDWSKKADYYDNAFKFYQGLIQLRKEHPAFHIDAKTDINNASKLSVITQAGGIVAYKLTNYANGDSWNNIYIAYNGTDSDKSVNLGASNLTYVVQGNVVNLNGIGDKTTNNAITVGRNSMVVLYDNALSFDVTFDHNYSSSPASVTSYLKNTEVFKPEDPARTGYDFEGWYTEDACTNAAVFPQKVTANVTFYAKWKAATYIVTFDKDGVTATVSSIYDGTVTEPTPVPTKIGYTFDKWRTGSATGNEYVFSTKITGDLTLYASWTIITYDVKYDFNGGTGADASLDHTANIRDDFTIATASGITPPVGQVFERWNTQTDGDGTDYEAEATVHGIQGDLTLYAIWVDIPPVVTHTVTFDEDGVTSTVSSIHGDTVTKPTPNPTKAGYTFDKWRTGSVTGNEYDFTTPVIGDLTLYASWTIITYNVTYDFNGGLGTSKNHTANIRDSFTIANASGITSPSGKMFVKWNTQADGLGTDYAAEETVYGIADNLTLYAIWDDIPTITHTVTFNGNGGTVSEASRTVEYGEEVGALPTPTYAGHRFDGWYTASSGGTHVTASTNITDDIILYAHWTPIYTITVTNGTADKTTAAAGETVHVTASAAPDGYVFDTWSATGITLSDAKLTSVSFTMPANNLTLTAQYELLAADEHVVSVIGGNAEPNRGAEGTVITVTADASEGKGFVEWTSTPAVDFDDEYSAITTFEMPDEPVEVEAIFADISYDIIVIDGTSDKSVAVKDEIVTITADSPPSGKEFSYWESDDVTFSDENDEETDFTMPAKDVTVTAVFTDIAVVNHTVTFDANGGEVSEASRSVAHGAAVGTLPTPTYSNHRFDGWFTAASGGTSVSASTQITGNVTFHAHWTPIYTVIFDANGGTVSEASRTVAHGEAIGTLPSTSYFGHIFSGWFTASTGGAAVSAATIIVNNIVFYAQWTENTDDGDTNGGDSGNTGNAGNNGSGGNSGSNGGTSGSSNSQSQSSTGNSGSSVIVDGKAVSSGVVAKSGDTTSVSVDQTIIGKQLETASKNITIVVPSDSNISEAKLLLKNIEDMATKDMTLTMQSDIYRYELPTTTVDSNFVMSQLNVDDPTKVAFAVSINTSLSESAIARVNDAVKNIGGSLVLPPIEFKVTASYNNKTVELNSFNKYVKRTVQVTAEQSRKITTAIVMESNGKTRHVPTNIYKKDNKWFAEINSLTNSTYTLISNEKTFDDIKGKWYEKSVSEMAARTIVTGDNGKFVGERALTRAEFCVLAVRTLGLPEYGNTSQFTDISEKDWYYGAVSTAVKYGLVTGKPNKIFDPYANITWQEAMTLVQRAAKVAGYKGYLDNLSTYPDTDKVSDWAMESVKFCVGSKLLAGNNNGMLNPQTTVSIAETADVFLKLLQKASVVDVR